MLSESWNGFRITMSKFCSGPIENNTVQKFIESMSRRCEKVLAYNGYPIDY